MVKWLHTTFDTLQIYNSTIPNDARNLDTLDLPPGTEQRKLFALKQVHSSRILNLEAVTQYEYGSDISLPLEPADGLVVNRSFLQESDSALLVRTADCIPLLILSSSHIALLHCGWRSVALQITESLQPYISDGEEISCFFGPCICEHCFEVGEELKAVFPSTFANRRVDLVQEILLALEQRYTIARVEKPIACTFEDPRFYSHRRWKQDIQNDARLVDGRNAMIVAAR
jgi:copper oxidase (laccase) domain-containing protein